MFYTNTCSSVKGELSLSRERLAGATAGLRKPTSKPSGEAADSLRETGYAVASSSDPGQSQPKNVGCNAGSTGVAADGCHRRVLAVLGGRLGHTARPDRLHTRIVGAAAYPFSHDLPSRDCSRRGVPGAPSR